MSDKLTNGSHSSAKPVQLSFPLPHSLGTQIHIHITPQKSSLLVFLTTVTGDSSGSGTSPAPLGSFVYALPPRTSNSTISSSRRAEALSTPLYVHPPTLDFATRLAKLLATRTGKPAYVGNSMSLAAAGRGGDVEEEMGVFGEIVRVVKGVVGRGG